MALRQYRPRGGVTARDFCGRRACSPAARAGDEP